MRCVFCNRNEEHLSHQAVPEGTIRPLKYWKCNNCANNVNDSHQVSETDLKAFAKHMQRLPRELHEQLRVEPDSLRDRIVLVNNAGTKWYCHASVVSLESPTLAAFYHGPFTTANDKETEFVLKDAGAGEAVVDDLLAWMYCRKLPAVKNLAGFTRLGDYLVVRDIKEAIVVVMKSAVAKEKSLSVTQLFDVMNALTDCNHQDILVQSLNFLTM